MAPNSETYIGTYPKAAEPARTKPPRLSMETLQRTISDITMEISKEAMVDEDDVNANKKLPLPPISEIEDAKCECCGMSEECTPEYISHVREKFSGKLVCGLCAEAVREEMGRSGGKLSQDEALSTHMYACLQFNRIGRAYPVLYQAEAMREILKKSCSSSGRAKSMSPRDKEHGPRKGTITRSSSCIPAITREASYDGTMVNWRATSWTHN